MRKKIALFLLSLNVLMAAAGQAGATNTAQPKTIEEGLHRLQQIFGEYDVKHQRLWWLYGERKTRHREQSGAPEVVWMMKDWLGFSAPYRLADLVAVDMVNKRQAWARVAGQEKIIHTQQRHIAMRYLFRPSSSGSWNVQLHMISHSMPEVARWTGRQGTVVWHEDGLEMITVGTDAFHRPDGTLRDAATHSVRRFIRAGDELRIKGTYSYYDFLTSPSGARLPVPDFSAPLLFTSDDPPQHAKFPIEYESRPPSAPPKAFFEETKESPRQP